MNERMNDNLMEEKLIYKFYRTIRKVYKLYKHGRFRMLECETNPDIISNHIIDLLEGDKPCMICRYGATELTAVFNYLGIKDHRNDVIGYLSYNHGPWWWNKQILYKMEHESGFFPLTNEALFQFGELMLEDSKEIELFNSLSNK